MKKFIEIRGLFLDPELVETAYWDPETRSICVHNGGGIAYSTGQNSVGTREEGEALLKEALLLPNFN